MDALVTLSAQITDRLLDILKDPTLELQFRNVSESYAEELESMLDRLRKFPRADREHEEFRAMMLPWLVLHSVYR